MRRSSKSRLATFSRNFGVPSQDSCKSAFGRLVAAASRIKKELNMKKETETEKSYFGKKNRKLTCGRSKSKK